MRIFILTTVSLFSLSILGQQQEQKPVFDNWFSSQPPPVIPQNNTPPPPPGVPLDGGLVALISAGAALGYKKYKDRQD